MYLASIQDKIYEGSLIRTPKFHNPYEDSRKTVIPTKRLILNDNFNDLEDNGWGRQVGTYWSAISGNYRYNSALANDALSYPANMVNIYDVDIYANLYYNGWGTSTGIRAGIAFRIQSTANYYFVGHDPRNNYLRVMKKFSGTWTTLASLFYTLIQPQWLYIRCQGASIKVWIDTLQINETANIEVTDMSLSYGKVGVACNKVNFDCYFIKAWDIMPLDS